MAGKTPISQKLAPARKKTKFLIGLWIVCMMTMLWSDLSSGIKSLIMIPAVIGMFYSCYALTEHIGEWPRHYTLSRNTIKSLVLVSSIGLSVFCVYLAHCWHVYQLHQNGVKGMAVITDKYATSRRRTSHKIDFRLHAGTQWIELDESLPEESWNKYSVGDTIDVLYLPANPLNYEIINDGK